MNSYRNWILFTDTGFRAIYLSHYTGVLGLWFRLSTGNLFILVQKVPEYLEDLLKRNLETGLIHP